jgi:hypothetical protein
MASKVNANSQEVGFYKSGRAWEYFLRKIMGKCAQCKLRKATIKTVRGYTTGIHVRSETKHKLTLTKRSSEKADDITENEKPPKQANTFDLHSICSKIMLLNIHRISGSRSRQSRIRGLKIWSGKAIPGSPSLSPNVWQKDNSQLRFCPRLQTSVPWYKPMSRLLSIAHAIS